MIHLRRKTKIFAEIKVVNLWKKSDIVVNLREKKLNIPWDYICKLKGKKIFVIKYICTNIHIENKLQHWIHQMDLRLLNTF